MVYYFYYSRVDKSSNRGWVKLIAYDGANEGCQFVSLNEANCAEGKYREIYIACIHLKEDLLITQIIFCLGSMVHLILFMKKSLITFVENNINQQACKVVTRLNQN